MLHEFITCRRNELIERCGDKARSRHASPDLAKPMEHGVPLFLQQLVEILRVEQLTEARDVAGARPAPAPTAIGRTAALHGAEMLDHGFSVDQLVHGYGDVCQAITDMAVEMKEVISPDEFRTLNRCLDNAIADAVTAYSGIRQGRINEVAEVLSQSLTYFSDEQKRLIDIAIQSYAAVRTGSVGMTGATGTLLIHALEELRALTDRTMPEVRLASAKTTLETI